jgi:DNA-binding LacI/PurR family transcriptional regulator
MATIRDVAAKAGVSVATVSRVLNGSGYADAATAQRVHEAVEALGYKRNVHWSRLASRSSRTVLFLLGNRETMNSMQMRLLVSCERVLHREGYDCLFTRYAYAADEKANDLALPRLLQQEGAVDGVILAGVHSENLLKRLDHMKLPSVLLASNFLGGDKAVSKNCVLYDDETGLYEATGYLLRLGHRRIGFIGDRGKAWFERRYQGYERAIREAGQAPIAVTAPWSVPNVDYGLMAAAELLRGNPAPTAILAGNDEIAAGVWKELVRRQIQIPTQMSLIGFGDRAEFSILEPALTSVTVFEEQLGERLATMLLERLANNAKPIASETFPAKLVERHSCGTHREVVPLRRSASF